MLNRQINVYSSASTDLMNWRYEGVAFRMPEQPLCQGPGANPSQPLTCYADRCKVLRNPTTGKYVMWCKSKPFASVAVADSATGPFRLVKLFNPGGHEVGDSTATADQRIVNAEKSELVAGLCDESGCVRQLLWRGDTAREGVASAGFQGHESDIVVLDEGRGARPHPLAEEITHPIAWRGFTDIGVVIAWNHDGRKAAQYGVEQLTGGRKFSIQRLRSEVSSEDHNIGLSGHNGGDCGFLGGEREL